MIYIEEITDNHNIYSVERQKNKPNGRWYGTTLLADEKIIADNEDWICQELYPALRHSPAKTMNELGLPKEDAKTIRKIILKAIELGWFKLKQQKL